MALNRFHVVSPLALIVLNACKFGQNNSHPASTPVTGNIIKGPLNNALVFLDLDDDNVLDANEQSIRTGADGSFIINTTSTNYKIVALTDDSTVDTSSGAVLSGVTLTAPKGAAVVTPTTTLMEEGNLTAKQVAEVLSLPKGVDPLKFNPFASGVDATTALEVEKISHQIMTAISSFASATEGAGAAASDAFTTAMTSVVDVIKSKAAKINDPNAAAGDKKLDFTKASDLALIKTEVTTKATKLTGINVATINALVNDTTDAIKNVNDKISTVTDLKSDATKNIFSTTQVLRDQVKEAAFASKKGDVPNISFKSKASVEIAMLNKAPQDINLTGGERISESASSLDIGIVSTVDIDQTSGTAFKYTLIGKDAALFTLNESTGVLSLKAKPDYAKKPYYELTIVTKDTGGKKYAEIFKINVLKDSLKDGNLSNNEPTGLEADILSFRMFKEMGSAFTFKTNNDGNPTLVDQESDVFQIVKNSSTGIAGEAYKIMSASNNPLGFFQKVNENTQASSVNIADLTSFLSQVDKNGALGLAMDTYFDVVKKAEEPVSLNLTEVKDQNGHFIFATYMGLKNPIIQVGIDITDPNNAYMIQGPSIPARAFQKIKKLNANELNSAIDAFADLAKIALFDDYIDSKGPVFTDFSIKTAKPSLGEKITIEFKATDDTHVGYFNASFSSVDDPNKKINIKAQNKANTEKLSDHFDFSLNSNNFYELSVPLLIVGELKGGNYKLDSFSASDAKTTKNPNINNESKYGSSVKSADNAKFFNDLSNTDLLVTIPVLESNPGLPVINEQESNATLERANSILPDKLVKGTVFPNGEDWFKFDLKESGTIVAQMDMGTRSADLKLYGPDKKEIISKEVVKSGMIHHTASDVGEYYLLVTDGNINNSAYELVLDIV